MSQYNLGGQQRMKCQFTFCRLFEQTQLSRTTIGFFATQIVLLMRIHTICFLNPNKTKCVCTEYLDIKCFKLPMAFTLPIKPKRHALTLISFLSLRVLNQEYQPRIIYENRSGKGARLARYCIAAVWHNGLLLTRLDNSPQYSDTLCSRDIEYMRTNKLQERRWRNTRKYLHVQSTTYNRI